METEEMGNGNPTSGSINSDSDTKREKKKKKKKMGYRRQVMAFVRRLQPKGTTPSPWRWRRTFLGSAFKWKLRAGSWPRRFSFLDDVLFKIVYVLEAVVLVGSLCFFFICCGCHF